MVGQNRRCWLCSQPTAVALQRQEQKLDGPALNSTAGLTNWQPAGHRGHLRLTATLNGALHSMEFIPGIETVPKITVSNSYISVLTETGMKNRYSE